MELEQGDLERRRHRNRKRDVNHLDIAYSSSPEDCDNKDRKFGRKRHPKDDYKYLKIEALDFNGNLNSKKKKTKI